MTVRVSLAAQADILRTARFYDRQPGRYGDAFNREVRAAIAQIQANPRLHPPAEDAPHGVEVREFFIARFDQRVIYRVDGDDILVVSVTHTSRRPGAWHSQLDAP